MVVYARFSPYSTTNTVPKSMLYGETRERFFYFFAEMMPKVAYSFSNH